MNTDNLILRETDNLPLINKDDTLTNAEIDGNFINIYNDFISLSQANDPTLIYDVDRSYLVDEFATYNGRLWIATEISTGVTPIEGSAEWNDVFPTVLAHEKNKDTYLDYGGANATSVAEIRAFIDAGLTSTTNLSLSTKTATSFKIESSTGTDVILPQANSVEAGLLNAEDKVKLDNTSGINTGDQTLASLSGEDVTNKVTDFTTINNTLYPTTQAVDTYITAQIPSLVETFIDGAVELNTNKATTFAIINDTLYPSVKAVDDQLDLKVDKVVGSRLITSAESTLLGNTSGTNTGDQTFLNARVQTVTSSATVTPLSTNDEIIITAQAVSLTLANPTGTFTEGQAFIVRIKDNGTAQSIAYGTNYRGTTLPTTTTVGTTTYLPFIYNSTDGKFDNLSASGITTTIPAVIQLACSDETTALTAGISKVTFRMPHAMTLTSVRASLNVAGTTSGITTIDINEGGVSILSTKLTIDLTEKTSTTAAIPSVISDTSLADDAEITIDIDAISGGATEKGLKISLIGTRTI